MRSFEAVAALAAEYSWAIDLEICVFPQDGMTNYPGTEELLVAALKQGAPVLGAAPRYDSDPAAQIERIFALASEFDVDLDLHLDVGDDPRQMHIYQVLDLTERYKRGGRVVAGHMAKLSLLPPAEVAALARRLADAGIAVTVLTGDRSLSDGARARPRRRARRRRRQPARRQRRHLLDFEQQRAERGDPVRRLLADPHGEYARQYSADRGARANCASCSGC